MVGDGSSWMLGWIEELGAIEVWLNADLCVILV